MCGSSQEGWQGLCMMVCTSCWRSGSRHYTSCPENLGVFRPPCLARALSLGGGEVVRRGFTRGNSSGLSQRLSTTVLCPREWQVVVLGTLLLPFLLLLRSAWSVSGKLDSVVLGNPAQSIGKAQAASASEPGCPEPRAAHKGHPET